jgi:hypothetical protein
LGQIGTTEAVDLIQKAASIESIICDVPDANFLRFSGGIRRWQLVSRLGRGTIWIAIMMWSSGNLLTHRRVLIVGYAGHFVDDRGSGASSV